MINLKNKKKASRKRPKGEFTKNVNESRAVSRVGPSPRITGMRDAGTPVFRSPKGHRAESVEVSSRLALFYELPLQLCSAPSLDALLQLIVKRATGCIPGARRGALLLGEELLLRAFHPPDSRPSTTLARQAMKQQKALSWSNRDQLLSTPPASVLEYKIQSGMYAPLIWRGDILGVLCVDSYDSSSAFDADDLQLLQAVAHHAAMAVAQYSLQDKLRRQVVLTERLFSSRFPPKVRGKLAQQATTGALPLGTQQSVVTILISDIRGFTLLTKEIGPQRMTDMLNEYFPPLIEAIFEHNGTIERFVGDAIFAVFGSPEPNDHQSEAAVRAALSMQERVKALNSTRKARSAATCEIGIGIDCGEVLHGFIGNAERMEFTVVGDAANSASRYCNGADPGEVLISPRIHQKVWRMFFADQRTVPTKHEGNWEAYHVTGVKNPTTVVGG